MRYVLVIGAATFGLTGSAAVRAGGPEFAPHVIKPPRPGAEGNTVPSMVWLHDVNADGRVDLLASHIVSCVRRARLLEATLSRVSEDTLKRELRLGLRPRAALGA